jgi:thiol-disulfide isomerase/thioredoxin
MNRMFFVLLFSCISINLFSQMRPGVAAQDLSLPDMDGIRHKLSDLKGKVVLIDFWASWCGPCRHNNPHLVKLYNKYHDKGLEIYGISLDDDPTNWVKAVHHDKLTWLQVIDDQGWASSSANIYGVDMIPSSFLLDKNGIIRTVNAEGNELENSIKDLLKE